MVIVGVRLQIGCERLLRILVFALVHQCLGVTQIHDAVRVLVLDRCGVGANGFGVVQYTAALTLAKTDMCLQFALLLGIDAFVALLVYLYRIVILADLVLLVGFLHTLLNAA